MVDSCRPRVQHRLVPVTGVFAFDVSVEMKTLLRSCRDWGVDMPIVSPGFFTDGRGAAAVDAAGADVWLNVPVFYQPAYLQAHPERYAITSLGRRAEMDWLHFACPSRDETVDSVLQELRTTLSRLRPAVVTLDFIRHFVFWERVPLTGRADGIEDGCYCPLCLSRFAREYGERVDDDDPAGWIRRHCSAEWAEWKCDRITAVAERLFAEIRALSDGAMLGVKTIPWRDSDLEGAIRRCAGQDVPRLAQEVDLVSPMTFTHLLRQDPEWKRDLLDHVREVTGRPVAAYVQTDAADGEGAISTEQFDAELATALCGDYAAVAIFHHQQPAADGAKAEILRRRLTPSGPR